MVEFDWLHVFFIAVMGASLAMALRTGSLWPFSQMSGVQKHRASSGSV
jgi:hypothetical protein